MPPKRLLFILVLLILPGCLPSAEAADPSLLEKIPPFYEAHPEGLFEEAEIELSSGADHFEELNLQTSLLLEEQRCHVGMSYFDGRTVENFEGNGLSFSFPYAPKWAHSTEKPRYEWVGGMEYETLRFGPVGAPEGCSLASYYFVSFLPAGTSDSVGGMGMCGPRPFTRLEGSSYTYEFYPLCGDEDEQAVLERIVATASYK